MEWRSSSVAFDLTLDVHEAEDGIWASFGYATDLFEASTVERLARHWQNLLRGIVAEPGRPVAELPLLLDEERDCLSRAWAENADEGGLPPLVQLQIQEQARLRPQAQALALEGQAPELRRAQRPRQSSGSLPDSAWRRSRCAGGNRRRALAGHGGRSAGDPQGRWCLCAAGPDLSAGPFASHARGQRRRPVAQPGAFAARAAFARRAGGALHRPPGTGRIGVYG